MIVLAYVTSEPRAIERLRRGAVILLAIQAIPAALLSAELWPTATRVFTVIDWSAVILGGLVVGMVAPFLVAILTAESVWLLVASLLVIAGSAPVRYAIVYLPQQSAKRTHTLETIPTTSQ